MELSDFIQNMAAQFEDTDALEFTADTLFRELDEWTSLMALSIIAMIDEEYEISVNGNDIRQAETIGDLFDIVKAKK